MHWQFTPYIVLLIVAGIASLALAALAWVQRRTAGARALAVLMLAIAVWALGYACELGSGSLSAKVAWAKVQYLGIVVVPVAWLAFVLGYTGRSGWLSARIISLALVLPMATLLLTWTNEAHHLVWKSVSLAEVGEGTPGWRAVYGWGFWVHTAYSYLLLLLSTLLLLYSLVRSMHLYRAQAATLLLGAAVPWMGNVVSISGILPVPLDLTPLGFSLAGLAIGWVLFRTKLRDILPLARDAVVESLPAGVVVLDSRNRVIDLNPAAQRILGCEASHIVGLVLDEALAVHSELVEQCRTMSDPESESVVGINVNGGPDIRLYAVHISPLYAHSGQSTGRLVVLRDVTDQKRAEEALRSQKDLFEGLVAVARATTERPTLEATLQDALTTFSALTGAEYGTLLILNEDGVVTHHLVMRGRDRLEHWRERTGLVMDEGLAGWVVRHRQLAIIDDALDDERWLADGVSTVRSALSVPIVSGPTVLGVLTLTHSEPAHFTSEHSELMRAAGDQVMLALRNAQIFDAQQRIAEQQSTLYHVLRAVVGQTDPESVIELALDSIRRFAGWRNVVVATLNEERTEWEVSAYGEDAPPKTGRSFPTTEGIIGRAVRTLETQCVPDVEVDPDYITGRREFHS
jgi:PAS domain S-box-containing protein